MPYLELMVNVQVGLDREPPHAWLKSPRFRMKRNLPSNFPRDAQLRSCFLGLELLIQVGAKALGKPEAYITVSITHNKTLTFGGTLEPAFALVVTSLDNLNPEANEKYSAILTEFLKEKLNIPNDRGYITFQDPGRGFLGYKGTTFASLWAK